MLIFGSEAAEFAYGWYVKLTAHNTKFLMKKVFLNITLQLLNSNKNW